MVCHCVDAHMIEEHMETGLTEPTAAVFVIVQKAAGTIVEFVSQCCRCLRSKKSSWHS